MYSALEYTYDKWFFFVDLQSLHILFLKINSPGELNWWAPWGNVATEYCEFVRAAHDGEKTYDVLWESVEISFLLERD